MKKIIYIPNSEKSNDDWWRENSVAYKQKDLQDQRNFETRKRKNIKKK